MFVKPRTKIYDIYRGNSKQLSNLISPLQDFMS